LLDSDLVWPVENNPCVNIKQKVKKLLRKDKTDSFIARQLSIPRSRVMALKKEIIQDKKKWNKKKRLLDEHYPLIMNCTRKKQDAKQIHAYLLSINVRLSYSTVARYTAFLVKKQKASMQFLTPGSEGKVFFMPIGKFKNGSKKINAWVFFMRLSYSKYSFYQLVGSSSFVTFLDCHLQAFLFFKGIPHTIRVNYTAAFNMNIPAINEKYIDFLRNFGTVLVPGNKRCSFIHCARETRFFKENFQYHTLHRNYKRLEKELQRWYTTHVNLGVHPITNCCIKKEFLKKEQPAMLPLKKFCIVNTKSNEPERKKN